MIPLRLKARDLPKLKTFTSGDAEICIWKIDEGVSDFVAINEPYESKNEKRSIQWMSSRMALTELDIDPKVVLKDEHGKPHVSDSDQHISISHCKQYAGAIKSQFAVGLDIEEITPRIERIAKRFVNPAEEIIVQQNDRLQALYLLWSAKEALYKLYGKKAVDFKQHMVASPFKIKTKGKFYMEFLKDKPMLYIMNYEIFDNHTLVWVVE